LNTFFAFDVFNASLKRTQASGSIAFERVIDFDCSRKEQKEIGYLVLLGFVRRWGVFEPFTLLAGAIGRSIAGGGE
jgi:hypothetical protein